MILITTGYDVKNRSYRTERIETVTVTNGDNVYTIPVSDTSVMSRYFFGVRTIDGPTMWFYNIRQYQAIMRQPTDTRLQKIVKLWNQQQDHIQRDVVGWLQHNCQQPVEVGVEIPSRFKKFTMVVQPGSTGTSEAEDDAIRVEFA
jgi:hypothetical protein